MGSNNNIEAFFTILKAGLWEKEARLFQLNGLDYKGIYRIAEEQSVVGLVAAGLDYIIDIKAPKEDSLQFVGHALQLEQRNLAMNFFVGEMVRKMRESGIYTLIVKGQGIAQCYIRPLWRASGDVDFLLDEDNYGKAKKMLSPMAVSVDPESGKHLGMTIGPWVIELHGNLHCGLSPKMDKVIDETQNSALRENGARSWLNGKTTIFLPNADDDIVFVFTHFLKHFISVH